MKSLFPAGGGVTFELFPMTKRSRFEYQVIYIFQSSQTHGDCGILGFNKRHHLHSRSRISSYVNFFPECIPQARLFREVGNVNPGMSGLQNGQNHQPKAKGSIFFCLFKVMCYFLPWEITIKTSFGEYMFIFSTTSSKSKYCISSPRLWKYTIVFRKRRVKLS